jgi:glycosyltransferase involved in cell wall biosynthesis
MANLLILNRIVPYPLNFSGNTVRTLPLSVELSRRHRCFLAAFGDKNQMYERLRQTGIYEDILLLPPSDGRESLLRSLSLNSGHLARLRSPDYYNRTVKLLRSFSEKKRIELTLAHGLDLAEFMQAVPCRAKIMDDVDCGTLAIEREYACSRRSLDLWNKLRFRLLLHRTSHQEGLLTSEFDLVTTISPVDRDALRKVSRHRPERVVDIPNGVADGFLNYKSNGSEMSDAFCFWGTLDFPPNRSAVNYFYREVFLKYLLDRDVRWFIVGRNPTEEMVQMSRRHSNIIVTGFVEDLPGLVCNIPVMVNPMLMGGGLKNKVLEAFAMRRLVISNGLGIEAIKAEAGVHYVRVEAPSDIAALILKHLKDTETRARMGQRAREFVLENYSWEKVGSRFLDLIDGLLEGNKAT